jgi:hypothetical protein
MYFNICICCRSFNKSLVLFQPYRGRLTYPSGDKNGLTCLDTHHESRFGIHEITGISID